MSSRVRDTQHANLFDNIVMKTTNRTRSSKQRPKTAAARYKAKRPAPPVPSSKPNAPPAPPVAEQNNNSSNDNNAADLSNIANALGFIAKQLEVVKQQMANLERRTQKNEDVIEKLALNAGLKHQHQD